MLSLNELREIVHGDIRISEPLAGWTTFRVGGPADFYLEPESKQDLTQLLSYLRKRNCPFILIVSVSHLLVSERGFRGAVINIERCLTGITLLGETVRADAGARLGALSEFCVARGFAGAEVAAGLQGTVAGGILRDVKARGKRLNGFLTGVELLRDGNTVNLRGNDVPAGIRRTGPDRDIILSASFRFPAGKKEEILRVRRELLIERNALQPINVPGGGAIFKDTAQASAAQLLRRAGFRRKRLGGAAAGDVHANCIVNEGGAASADIVALIRAMQRAVQVRLRVNLELDLRLIGFEERNLREVV